MENNNIKIIFIMENQEPTILKVNKQMQVQSLLALLKKKSVEKKNDSFFQANQMVIMIPPPPDDSMLPSASQIEAKKVENKPKEQFFASSQFQCAPEAYMLPMPPADFFFCKK